MMPDHAPRGDRSSSSGDQFSWEWEEKGHPASAQPGSCKTIPPPKRHKICPSRHGDETVSTCSITPSDPLCHRSSAAQRCYL